MYFNTGILNLGSSFRIPQWDSWTKQTPHAYLKILSRGCSWNLADFGVKEHTLTHFVIVFCTNCQLTSPKEPYKNAPDLSHVNNLSLLTKLSSSLIFSDPLLYFHRYFAFYASWNLFRIIETGYSLALTLYVSNIFCAYETTHEVQRRICGHNLTIAYGENDCFSC